MPVCQYALTKPTAAASQSKREVLFCRCVDCQDARAMNAGTLLSLRKAVRERVAALQYKPEPPPIADEPA